MATGDKLVTLDGLKAVYDKAISPANTLQRLYPFDVSGDTIIYNDANQQNLVYCLKPVTVASRTVGAGIKYLHITTDRADRFYIHVFFAQNSAGKSVLNISSLATGAFVLRLEVDAENDPARDANGVGTYELTSADGGTTATVVVDWNLVNKSYWTAGGSGDAYKPTFRNLVTISEACVERTPSVTYLNARVAELQQQINAAMTRGIHIYGAKWDKTNAACTRVFEAAGISTDVTNFCHKGTVNASYQNPFDNIYPWNLFRQCNVDLTKYAALKPGDDIRQAVVAWYGEPGFKDDGSNGFVGAYRPQYWYTAYEDGDSVIFAVADGKMDGWAESPAYIRGYGFAVDAGESKLSCYNDQPLTNVALSTLHTRANNSGFTIEDIYTYSAELTAFVVEYATMNTQAAIGEGCDACYRSSNDDKPHIAETGATRVVLPAACAAFALEGVTLDFGATKDAVIAANRRTCTGYEAYSDNDYISVTFDEALDVTTDMFVSFHGMANGDAIGNASGFIGTAGKHNAFYRGAVLHANRWRYVLGAYRQTGTGKVWICPADDDPDAYNALNTSKHTDTGVALPESKSGVYIDELAVLEGLGAVPVAPAAGGGGSSSNPVGDALYTPAASTGNTVLLAGGTATTGTNAGAFYSGWHYAASYSSWGCAVLPVLKNP